jgi:hypothetical protein
MDVKAIPAKIKASTHPTMIFHVLMYILFKFMGTDTKDNKN